MVYTTRIHVVFQVRTCEVCKSVFIKLETTVLEVEIGGWKKYHDLEILLMEEIHRNPR